MKCLSIKDFLSNIWNKIGISIGTFFIYIMFFSYFYVVLYLVLKNGEPLFKNLDINTLINNDFYMTSIVLAIFYIPYSAYISFRKIYKNKLIKIFDIIIFFLFGFSIVISQRNLILLDMIKENNQNRYIQISKEVLLDIDEIVNKQELNNKRQQEFIYSLQKKVSHQGQEIKELSRRIKDD